MKYQFQIDRRPVGPVREKWYDAASDAVRAGHATFVVQGHGLGIRIDDQAEIARIEDGIPVSD